MEWQPIETAPKDGTPILGARFHKYIDGSVYVDGAVMMFEPGFAGVPDGWAYMGFSVELVGGKDLPTHWMPLPAPPVSA